MAEIGYYGISQRDFDGEMTTATFRVTAVTAANHDAQVTAMDALKSAIDGVTVGTIARDAYGNKDEIAISKPSLEWAQRETGWLLVGYDSTEMKWFKNYVGCADLTLLDETETDPNLRKSLALGSGAGATLKTAYEAVVISPWGNAATLSSVIQTSKKS